MEIWPSTKITPKVMEVSAAPAKHDSKGSKLMYEELVHQQFEQYGAGVGGWERVSPLTMKRRALLGSSLGSSNLLKRKMPRKGGGVSDGSCVIREGLVWLRVVGCCG